MVADGLKSRVCAMTTWSNVTGLTRVGSRKGLWTSNHKSGRLNYQIYIQWHVFKSTYFDAILKYLWSTNEIKRPRVRSRKGIWTSNHKSGHLGYQISQWHTFTSTHFDAILKHLWSTNEIKQSRVQSKKGLCASNHKFRHLGYQI